MFYKNYLCVRARAYNLKIIYVNVKKKIELHVKLS